MCFSVKFSKTIHLLWDGQAQTTTVTQPFSHTAQSWARQFGSRAIYTVPCLGMDLVILIFFFFLCLSSLSLLWRLRNRETEREGGGGTKKTKKKKVWPKPSQLSPRCLTEVIVSDRGGSHEPRTETWLELATNKTQFSRSEETAVLNKTKQRMWKKRFPAEDKVESCLPFPPPPPLFLRSPVTHILSYSSLLNKLWVWNCLWCFQYLIVPRLITGKAWENYILKIKHYDWPFCWLF